MITEDLRTGSFHWFHGVVESVNDPEQMGRMKVRCIGYHTDDRKLLPTEALPWATPLMPLNSASISSIGISATGVLPGSWVIGFFRDGAAAQDPIILGTIQTSTSPTNPSKGFSDPMGTYPNSNFELDIPVEATYGYIDSNSYNSRIDLKSVNIITAIPPKVSTVAPDKAASYYERKKWSTPDPEKTFNPIYPKNQVFHTEAGHVIEFDNTRGKERISVFHKSGTHHDILFNGDNLITVVGDNYLVVNKNNNVLIKGDYNLTVEGNMRVLVKGNYHLETTGDVTEKISKDKQIKIGGSEHTEIGFERVYCVADEEKSLNNGDVVRTFSKNLTYNIGEVTTISSSGDLVITSSEDLLVSSLASTSITVGSYVTFLSLDKMIFSSNNKVYIKGSTINLNPSTIPDPTVPEE